MNEAGAIVSLGLSCSNSDGRTHNGHGPILQFAPQARLHAGRPERCFDRESVAGAK